MTGPASGGQKLTPNPNVEALSGIYGDQWGANGGGATPVGGAPSVQTTLSRGQRETNGQIDQNLRTVAGVLSTGAVNAVSPDATSDNQYVTVDSQSITMDDIL